MSTPQTNSDALIKQKFEQFEAVPPAGTWDIVKAGIVPAPAPSYLVMYWKPLVISAAVIILAVVTGLFLFNSEKNEQIDDFERDNEKIITDTGGNDLLPEENLQLPDENQINNESEKPLINSPAVATKIEIVDDNAANGADNETVVNSKLSKTEEKFYSEPVPEQIPENSLAEGYQNTGHGENLGTDNSWLPPLQQRTNMYGFSSYKNEYHPLILTAYSLNFALSDPQPDIIIPGDISAKQINPPSGNRGGWSMGLYFTPEIMLNTFDSVEILATYSLGIEPTFYINKRLFLRSGIGLSYARDRGFAKLDYMRNELLGTYDHVYDITFDSVDGVVVPTYHTMTMEVWDTVRNHEINAVTNEYFYAQIPLMLGYSGQSNKLRWYFYGGPAMNILLSKRIEQPLSDVDYVEINALENNLPVRSNYYFQLWVGAGIEYKLGPRLGIGLEPNYRYYFKNVFNEPPYDNSGLSSLSLRLGLVYTIHE